MTARVVRLGSRRGMALFIATVGAALGALVALTASLLAEREVRSAAAWSAAVRVEAGLATALDRVLTTWPTAFRAPSMLALGPVTDSLGGVRFAVWLAPVSDSTGWLVAQASQQLGAARGTAQRLGALLVSLQVDTAGVGVVTGVVPATTGWDWSTLAR